MTRMPTCLTLALCASLLVACGERTRTALGYGKQSPDEFSVVTRAPLSIPPDYGLRPPTPGVSRPQEQETAESARRLLLRSVEQKWIGRGYGPECAAIESWEASQKSGTDVASAMRAAADAAERQKSRLTAVEKLYGQLIHARAVVRAAEREAQRLARDCDDRIVPYGKVAKAGRKLDDALESLEKTISERADKVPISFWMDGEDLMISIDADGAAHRIKAGRAGHGELVRALRAAREQH